MAVLSGALLLAAPARASGDTDGPAHVLRYDGYVAGLRISELTAAWSISERTYDVSVTTRLIGIVGALTGGRSQLESQGHWRGLQALPHTYHSQGSWHGEPRETVIEYPDGAPVVMKLEPLQDTPREPVPPQLQRASIDGLSALAMLLRQVEERGICDGALTSFDGRRVTRLTAIASGREFLLPERHSRYHGEALRCDFVTQQIAGLPTDLDADDALHRPMHAIAWFAAPQPGAPVVPVVISVELRLFGHMMLYLADARNDG